MPRPESRRTRHRRGGDVPRRGSRRGPQDDRDGPDAVGRAALLRVERSVARGGPEGPVRGIRASHGGDPRDLPRHHRWEVVASRQGSSVDVPGDSRHAEGVDRNDSEAGRGRLKRSDIRVGIVYIEGTNCEEESVAFFRHLGAQAEKVHLKQLTGDVPPTMKRTLDDFDLLMIPGGFAAGGYVRAGAVFAARLRSKLSKEFREFVEAGKPLFGVCNGFQVLVEAGPLPPLGGATTRTPGGPL